MYFGLFVEYVVVCVVDINLVVIFDSVDVVVVVVLGCWFVIVYWVVIVYGWVGVGIEVVVFGCGGVGLLVVMIVMVFGVMVMVVDVFLVVLE